jgi:phospholipid/cholesterol/gamma-HCH transport system substrate-binding protein
MQKAFTDLQGTVTQLQGIMDKVNNNQGSLGMLVNNKDLYTNMNGTLKSLDQLLADMKEHPSRYINVTIFGKKK